MGTDVRHFQVVGVQRSDGLWKIVAVKRDTGLTDYQRVDAQVKWSGAGGVFGRQRIQDKLEVRLLKSVLAKDESEVVIRFDDRNAELTFSECQLQCRLIEGRYPNYNSVIPQDNPNELTIDRKLLIGALRRILPFASESSQLVRVHLELGKIELSSEDIDFSTSAKEEITCDYQGMPMDIGFKGSSLSEILNNLQSESVVLMLADPSRPCLIIPEEQPEQQDILMLIMPMLLND